MNRTHEATSATCTRGAVGQTGELRAARALLTLSSESRSHGLYFWAIVNETTATTVAMAVLVVRFLNKTSIEVSNSRANMRDAPYLWFAGERITFPRENRVPALMHSPVHPSLVLLEVLLHRQQQRRDGQIFSILECRC